MAPGFRGAAEGVGAATLKEILTGDLVLCRLCFYTAGMSKPIPAPDHIHSIPAGIPFATTLATGLVALAGTPRALAAATILVPSRRAALALRAAFLEINGSGAAYARIDPIGDVDGSPDILGMSATVACPRHGSGAT